MSQVKCTRSYDMGFGYGYILYDPEENIWGYLVKNYRKKLEDCMDIDFGYATEEEAIQGMRETYRDADITEL